MMKRVTIFRSAGTRQPELWTKTVAKCDSSDVAKEKARNAGLEELQLRESLQLA